jgi:hypothetical protein
MRDGLKTCNGYDNDKSIFFQLTTFISYHYQVNLKINIAQDVHCQSIYFGQ